MEPESRGGAGLPALARAQGAFFAASGVWPIVHLRSFEAVTGPKLEGWLVKTTGALIAVIGSALWLGGRRPAVPREVALLGAASALSLAAADLIYVARRRIAPVYLLDAAVELALAGAWGRGLLR